MKITRTNWFNTGGGRPLWRGGFTLPEMMVTMAIFAMCIGSLLTAHIFGARLFELCKGKLGASDEARIGLAGFLDQVRSNGAIYVGSGDASSFTRVADGLPQAGTAIQIYPTNATSSPVFVRYYVQSNLLLRIHNGDSAPDTIIHSIANTNVFSEEDSMGNVLTNYKNNRVIGMFLQITQLYSPQINIQTGGLFDYYQLRAKATRRQL